MKKIATLFTYIIFTNLFCTSCKKENTDPSPAEYHFPAEAFEYIRLKERSWFVYKDSSLDSEDSVIVSTSKLNTVYTPKRTTTGSVFTSTSPAYYYDEYTLIFSKPANNYKTWFSAKTKDQIPVFPYIHDTGYASMSDILHERSGYWPAAFTFPADSLIQKINIEGITYTDVIMTVGELYFGEDNPDNISEITYWAKGVGIIKWEITESTTRKVFTLLRHG